MSKGQAPGLSPYFITDYALRIGNKDERLDWEVERGVGAAGDAAGSRRVAAARGAGSGAGAVRGRGGVRPPPVEVPPPEGRLRQVRVVEGWLRRLSPVRGPRPAVPRRRPRMSRGMPV